MGGVGLIAVAASATVLLTAREQARREENVNRLDCNDAMAKVEVGLFVQKMQIGCKQKDINAL